MSDLDSITSDWRRFSKTRLEMLRLLIRKKSGKQERIQRREGASSAAAMHVPLSLSQQRLWFIDQLEGAGAAYNIASAVRLLGALDEHALRTALDTLVSRHEILRTVFVTAAGEPAQVIAERARFALREVDLSSLPNNEREARAVELSQEEASGRFDLSQGPLIRGALLKLAAQEHVLLVAMHHIVSDGWSMGILIRELSGLYGAYLEGRSNPLPTLPIQYADYAQWQRHWMVGEVLQKQLEYWRAHLQAAPSLLELPTDRARPAVQSYRGGSVAMVVGSELTQKLRSLSWRFDVTLYMTLGSPFCCRG